MNPRESLCLSDALRALHMYTKGCARSKIRDALGLIDSHSLSNISDLYECARANIGRVVAVAANMPHRVECFRLTEDFALVVDIHGAKTLHVAVRDLAYSDTRYYVPVGLVYALEEQPED